MLHSTTVIIYDNKDWTDRFVFTGNYHETEITFTSVKRISTEGEYGHKKK